MVPGGLCRLVEVTHFRQRLRRCVVVGHALEQPPAELALRRLRHLCQLLAVAEDDEAADAALEVRLGVPGDHSAFFLN